MSNTRVFTDPRSQHFKSDGVSSNSSGKLYFREPGSGSTTLKAIYSDKELSVQLLNPVTLDSNGRAPEIFLDGDYSVEMTDSADVQIWRIDNYQPPEVEGQFAEWGSTYTYAVNDYVRYTDGNYYVSLRSGNVGNVPSSSPAYWSQAFFITVYNASKSYSVGDLIYYDGNLYTSIQNNNLGNTPSTSFTFWQKPGVSVPDVTGFSGQIVKYQRSDPGSNLFIVFDNFDGSPPLFAEDTWSSIGPTGSGADVIWTELDDLPLNSEFATISISLWASRSSGSSLEYVANCSVRSSVTQPATGFLVAQVIGIGSSTEPDKQSNGIGVFDVPLSSTNTFELMYELAAAVDDRQLYINAIGFSTKEA